MLRSIALFFLCACVARTTPQGGNSAIVAGGPVVDAGSTPAADGGVGSPPLDAGSPEPDGGAAAAVDGGAWNAAATASLLAPAALSIADVSADEQRVLVSRTVPPADMELVTVGAAEVELASGTPYTSARFSSDGRAIMLLQPGTAQDDHLLILMRGDGSGARQLTTASRWPTFAGRWLYYDDQSGDDELLYRLHPPDGAPELIASFPPPHQSAGMSLDYSVSPDGESVLYCHAQGGGVENCFLSSPVSASLPVPGWTGQWAPDGTWFISDNCKLVDRSGASKPVCDPQSAHVSAISRDGSMLAILGNDHAVHLYSPANGATTDIPAPAFTDASYRPSYSLAFTPDGSRLLAFLGQSLLTTPVAGGPWTEIVNDLPPAPYRGSIEVSPDSRIVAAWSGSQGVMMSTDGAPPRAPFDSSVTGVAFEPAGGLGKAFFSRSYDNEPLTMANADGSDPVELPPMNCEWKGRTALCLRWHDMPYQTILISDEGEELSVPSHDTSNYPATAQLMPHRLFYIGAAGGLYVLPYRMP